MSSKSLSISIGESTVTVGEIEVHADKYTCRKSKSYEINNWASAEEVVGQWSNSIVDFATMVDLPITALHVAMPGPFDYSAGISYIKENRKLNSLYRKDVKALLAQQLGIKADDLVFYNDAVCALAADVSAMEAEKEGVLGLYFGEGFGSALLQHGKIKDMELWDETFSDAKTEDFFSLRWFRKTYFELTGFNVTSIGAINDFPSAAGKQLFKVFTDNLAVYIKSLVDEQAIGMIVLGGDVLSPKSNIMMHLNRKLSALDIDVGLVKSKLGHTAPLIGAAVLNDRLILES